MNTLASNIFTIENVFDSPHRYVPPTRDYIDIEPFIIKSSMYPNNSTDSPIKDYIEPIMFISSMFSNESSDPPPKEHFVLKPITFRSAVFSNESLESPLKDQNDIEPFMFKPLEFPNELSDLSTKDHFNFDPFMIRSPIFPNNSTDSPSKDHIDIKPFVIKSHVCPKESIKPPLKEHIDIKPFIIKSHGSPKESINAPSKDHIDIRPFIINSHVCLNESKESDDVPSDSTKIKFEIFGNTRHNKNSLWDFPSCVQMMGQYFPKGRPSKQDINMLNKMDCIHVSKHQRILIKLYDINQILPSNDQISILAKFVWTSDVSNQSILSLSKKSIIMAENINNYSTFINVLPCKIANEYRFMFYILKHINKASKYRCCLHILVKINNIEIPLVKYYIIIQGHKYTYGNIMSTFINNTDPLIKTDYINYPNK